MMGNKKYTQADFSRMHREAEAQMMKINGVVGVGFGVKEKAGELTEEIAFRVYVKEKKKENDLKQGEIIPNQIMGIKTDVLTIPDAVFTASACEDNNKTRPIVGGLTISNLKNPTSNPLAFERGSIGYFAQINSDKSKDNIVLFTNMHVASANGGKQGDPIFQPRTPVDLLKERADFPIGTIRQLVPIDNYPFQYPNETVNPIPKYYLDCASIKVNTDYSSCCDKNKGTEFERKIKNLDINGSDTITDIKRVEHSDLVDINGNAVIYEVYKSGRGTSKTTGRIVDIRIPNVRLNGIMAENLISIRATIPNCNNEMKFNDHGDSGSVVVNKNHEIVGLICSANPNAPFDAYACHIHPVLDKLKITILTSPIGLASGGRKTSIDPAIKTNFLSKDEELKKFDSIKGILLNATIGKNLYDLFEQNKFEVVNLINHKRHVTLTWHRNFGPAFVAHFVKNFHERDYVVPIQIKGITLSVLLKNMGEILYEHGTPSLKMAIEQYKENVISSAVDCNGLEALLTNICNFKPNE